MYREKMDRPESVNEVLDMIDDFFVSADGIKRAELWDILTALRGPDQDEMRPYKALWTSRIRTLAFPRTASSHRLVNMATFADSEDAKRLRDEARLSHYDHFVSHLMYARVALERIGRL